MNIIFRGSDKGLTDFDWKNIPQLAILTGVNGAGKSQILNLIRNHISNGVSAVAEPYIKKQGNYEIQLSNVEIERGSVLYWGPSGTHINLENSSFGYQDLKFIVSFLKNEINNLQSENQKLLQTEENDDHSIGKNKLKHVLNQKKIKIIEFIELETGKSRSDLTPADLSYYFPEDILLEDFDLFNQDSLDFIFFMYLYKKEASKRYNLSLPINKKAPWDILNEVIIKANLPYQVTHPAESMILPIFDNALNDVETDRFKVKLVDPKCGENIGFHNLSSGERIIASLALLLYYTQNRNQKKNLLILDEPDAHLHPSLTKQFFDVINDVIIKKYNGRVIMATHSASTVALAPNNSIYVMHKLGERIEKSTKDYALGILTAGVPSFSVNYENRRQVFVESPYDVVYYEKIHSKLESYLNPEISLSFISSGESRTDKNGKKISNCDQVINITKTLRDAGNKFIWGIIDWDTKNSTLSNVKVLGDGQRYSIENYIFDPLLMAALLLREKIFKREDLDLIGGENYTDFKNFNKDKLQFISDYFIEQVNSKFTITDSTLISVKLLNGLEINIPQWYLHNHGHDLEERILAVFPKLNSIKKGKEDALKLDIIDKVIDDIPTIISADFVEAFKYIQE